MSITGDDVLSLFEHLFAAERELALTTHIVQRREWELEQARQDQQSALEARDTLMAKMQRKARAVAGVHDEPDGDESPREYVPMLR